MLQRARGAVKECDFICSLGSPIRIYTIVLVTSTVDNRAAITSMLICIVRMGFLGRQSPGR